MSPTEERIDLSRLPSTWPVETRFTRQDVAILLAIADHLGCNCGDNECWTNSDAPEHLRRLADQITKAL